MRTRRMPIIAAVVLSAGLLRGQTFDRTQVPQTGPVPDIQVPAPAMFQLPNGLKVIASNDNRFPLTTFRLTFVAGSKFDPPKLPGLVDLLSSLLNQGTAKRSATQIAEESADLGGQITGSASVDTLSLNGVCLSSYATKFLDLLADVARNASFPADEVALQKQNRLQTLKAERSEPDYLGREALAGAIFGPHPYSHIGPTAEALTVMNRDEIVAFRDKYLVPNNAYLILVGQLPPADELKSMIGQYFGSWAKKEVPAYHPPAIPASRKQLLLVDRPGSVQANVYSAHVAPTYGSPIFFPMLLSDRILGGGTHARLFQDIREKRGFAYDAHTENAFHQEAGTLTAVTQVRNEVVGPALAAVNADLQSIGTTDVEPQELADAKSSYAGRFLLRLQQQEDLTLQLERIQIMHLPSDYLNTYMTHIRSVEPDQIRRTGKLWTPDDATLVVVGDAQKIRSALDKFGTVQAVTPQK